MRLALDQRLPDGLADVRQRWSFADTLEAHIALDALDEVAAHERAQRGSR